MPSTDKPVATILEESTNRGACGGLHFVRTIAPDDRVLVKLIEELAQRGIAAVPRVDPKGYWISKPAHIVILSEWDTPYGRSLGKTFADQASGQNDTTENRNKWIRAFHYLRGID